MASASTLLTVGTRHAGETFGHIAATDPDYCEWVLRSERNGNLREFAQYLQHTRGGILTFGRNRGLWYSDVLSSDPGWCDWAVSQSDPSPRLADFANFVRYSAKRKSAKYSARHSKSNAKLLWSSDSDSGQNSEADSKSSAPARKKTKNSQRKSISSSSSDSGRDSDADSKSSAPAKNKKFQRKASAAKAEEEVQKAKAQARRAKKEARQAKEEAKAQATKAMKAVEAAQHAKEEAKKAKEETRKLMRKASTKGEATRMAQGESSFTDGDGCKICMDNPVQTVFVPCGHMVACLSCSSTMKESSGKCPMCSKKIKKVIRAYKC